MIALMDQRVREERIALNQDKNIFVRVNVFKCPLSLLRTPMHYRRSVYHITEAGIDFSFVSKLGCKC